MLKILLVWLLCNILGSDVLELKATPLRWTKKIGVLKSDDVLGRSDMYGLLLVIIDRVSALRRCLL